MSAPSLVGPGLRNIERILVVLVRGGMGDVLLNTPVLEALRRRYPDAAIDMMVRPAALDMVAHHPALNELLTVQDGDLDRHRGFTDWLRQVRGRHYNLGLVLWSRFAEAWLLYRAGIRHRVGQDSRLAYSWMYTRRVHVRSEHGDTKSHWVECQLDYARAVGADLENPMPRLYLDARAEAQAREKLKAAGLRADERTIVLHVGRGTPLSPARLPTAPFSAAADALGDAFDCTVLLTGGAEERETIEAVAAGMSHRNVVLAGLLTVAELGGVLQNATLVVANDSGPMHMAAGLGVPTVGLFAMEKDLPLRWGPRGAGNEIVRPLAFRCRPDCRKETCRRMICYEDLTPGMIVDAARRALEARPKKSR